MVLNYSLGAEGCVFASCLAGGLERRRAKGPSRGVPGSPATWEGEELSRCRRDAPTRGGREATWVGFRSGSASPSPSSDFVTPFRLLSQASCRKETPRASPALREGPDPFFLGRGGLLGEGRHLPSPRAAFPPSAPGTSPSGESRRYPTTLNSRQLGV